MITRYIQNGVENAIGALNGSGLSGIKKRQISFDDIKIGDKLFFDDGKEKFEVTVTNINKTRGEMDVKWRDIETWILKSDFKNGYIKKIIT